MRNLICRFHWDEEGAALVEYGMLIGLIADTHGYLDPRVPPALKGVDLILHAR